MMTNPVLHISIREMLSGNDTKEVVAALVDALDELAGPPPRKTVGTMHSINANLLRKAIGSMV